MFEDWPIWVGVVVALWLAMSDDRKRGKQGRRG